MFGRDLDGGTALSALRVHGNKQGLFGGCLDIEVVFDSFFWLRSIAALFFLAIMKLPLLSSFKIVQSVLL